MSKLSKQQETWKNLKKDYSVALMSPWIADMDLSGLYPGQLNVFVAKSKSKSKSKSKK